MTENSSLGVSGGLFSDLRISFESDERLFGKLTPEV